MAGLDCRCGICIEEFPEKELIRYCDGKHVFCKSCINLWMMEKEIDVEHQYISCPMCRSNISIFSGYSDGTHIQYYLERNGEDEDEDEDENEDEEQENDDEEEKEEKEEKDKKETQKFREFRIKKGKLDGPYQEWSPKGFPRVLAFYKKGEIHGTYREFHDDSFVCKRVVNYKNGKKEGRETCRGPLGYVSSITEYRDGLRNGRHIDYHLKFDHIDLEGRLMDGEGREDGKIPIVVEMETDEHPENPVGVRKKEEGFYKDDNVDGEWKMWYPDGSLHMVSIFKDGMKNGLFLEYFSQEDGDGDDDDDDDSLQPSGDLQSSKKVDDSLLPSAPLWGAKKVDLETDEHPENLPSVRKAQVGFFKDDVQDGEWKTWDPDGSLRETCTYKDGEKHGLYIGWHSKKDGGGMEWKVNFIEGKREGYCYGWYPNGNLHHLRYYVGDKEHGIYYAWYESGRLYNMRYMFQGKNHGAYREWDQDGFLIVDENYWKGSDRGWSRRYYGKTRQLAYERFINDDYQREGTERAWYPNQDSVSGDSRLKFRIDFVKGMKEGLHEIWYCPMYSPGPGGDGNGLQTRAHFVADKKHGLYQEWWPNGQLKMQYNAVDGYRDGLFQRWAENGTLVEQYWSVKDRAEGLHTFWHDNGVKAKEYTCVNDKPVGLYQEWDRDGVLKREESWVNLSSYFVRSEPFF